VHDAMVKRLVLRLETTDEAVGMLARRFPAVVSLEFKWKSGGPVYGVLTDQGMLGVSSLTSLKTLNLTKCCKLSDEGMRAVSSCTSLTSLNFSYNNKVTNVGLRELRGLTALTELNLDFCPNVTDVGLQELTTLTALNTLHLVGCSTTKAGRDALKAAIPGLTIPNRA
jgi:hypothetical protein